LVRDLLVGTPAWQRLFHQARNASESRNATHEGWSLKPVPLPGAIRGMGKHLPVYGQPRGRALTCLADTWSTLTTLARLVREATHAAHFI